MSDLKASILLQAIDRMTGPMRGAVNNFKRATSEMSEAGKRAAKSMEGIRNASNSMRQAGQSMALRVTAPIVAFGGLTLRSAANFEAAMNKVGVLTNATSEDLQRLEAQARELGRTTQFSASQAADGMGFLAMAGFNTEKIIASMPGTLQLAAAANMDLAQAADIVTNIMSGYGFQASDLEKVNDVLVKSFTSANTDLSQLAIAMRMAGPVAKGLGIDFEETAAVLGIMGDNGFQASIGGTALRGTLSRLVNPAKDAQRALGRLGIKKSDIVEASGQLKSLTEIIRVLGEHGAGAGELMEIFGERAGPAMTAVVAGGADAVAELTAKLKESGGTAVRVAEAQMKGAAGEVRKLTSAFEGLQLAIADSGLLEWFTDLVQRMTSWIQSLSESSQTALKWGTIIAGVAAAVAPLVIAIGSLGFALNGLVIGGAAIKAFSVALMATPLGWFMAAIAAIAGAAYLIYDNWEPISTFFSNLWDGIVSKFTGAFDTIRSGLDTVNGLIPEGFKSFFGFGDQAPAAIAPSAFPNGPGGGRSTVGGEISIRIDSEGRPRVSELKSKNKAVGITVDTGFVMAGG
ncbi:MAG: phage tail tape measure protein [Rhodospirillales bacterium]